MSSPQRRRPTALLACLGAGLSLASAAHAACPASPSALAERAQQATDAFGRADLNAFGLAMSTLEQEAGCLSAPPTPAQAARVFEAEGLQAFMNKDRASGLSHFQAMHAADPDAQLSPSAAPPGGLVQGWWSEALALPPSGRAAVNLPRGLSLIVDGAPSADRPTGRAALIVVQDAKKAVLWSGLLPADQPLPASITAMSLKLDKSNTKPSASGLPGGAGDSGKPKAGLPVLLTAGGVALASGGLWAVSLSGVKELSWYAEGIRDNQTEGELGASRADIEALQRRTRSLGYAAQASTGLALGLGAVGVVLVW